MVGEGFNHLPSPRPSLSRPAPPCHLRHPRLVFGRLLTTLSLLVELLLLVLRLQEDMRPPRVFVPFSLAKPPPQRSREVFWATRPSQVSHRGAKLFRGHLGKSPEQRAGRRRRRSRGLSMLGLMLPRLSDRRVFICFGKENGQTSVRKLRVLLSRRMFLQVQARVILILHVERRLPAG